MIEAANVLPGPIGFLPLEQSVPSTSALGSTCRGAVSVIKDDGSVATYAGTQTGLYKLNALSGWTDVTRLTGGAYNVGPGEMWKYTAFGTRLLATNAQDGLSCIDMVSGTAFATIAAAPKARYIDVVRDFVLLGAIDGDEKSVHWSANNNSDSWTPGVNESDFQAFPNGGPVRGVIGGEVGYIMQATRITRMTYAPGSPFIFQMDEVEGGVGLAAPHSLVRLRNEAYFMARDGIRKMVLSGGKSQPVGIGKWAKWLARDMRQGTELSILSAANPVKPVIVWAYISRDAAGNTTTPNRILIYDWSIDDATYADLTVEALVQWLSPGVTLDTMGDYGALDDLQFSLDSPFWIGGSAVMGLFDDAHKLALQSGPYLEARFETSDGQQPSRVLIKGVRPTIDASACTIAIAARERDGDPIIYATAESMEDTGVVPAHASGNLARARVVIPAGTSWSLAQGITPNIGKRGMR